MSNKIWIHGHHYIQVSDEGFIEKNKWSEGTLGIVIELLDGDGESHKAIKVPRLIADTMRENAYISAILDEEQQNALDATKKVRFADVLLKMEYRRQQFFKRERATSNSPYGEAIAQHGNILFISYDKGTRVAPRLCSCREMNGQFIVAPQTMKEEFIAFLSQVSPNFSSSIEGWNQLKKYSEHWVQTAYGLVDAIELGRQSAANLAITFEAKYNRKAWYVGIPSFVLEWAECTLEEAFGRGHTARWLTSDYLTLAIKLSKGIAELHRNGQLHGDIRPANIMAVGNYEEPTNYRVSDYGSFAKDKARLDNAGITGNTMLGPGIGRQRISPFYSPERRTAFESELADMAVILPLSYSEQTAKGIVSATCYGIVLGWDADLVTKVGEQRLISEALKKKVSEAFSQGAKGSFENKERTAQPGPDGLQSGDRVRIRDYMFEVRCATRLNTGELVCFCEGRYSIIHNERIAVFVQDDTIKEEMSVSLSSYLVYYQWSAATDIYGLGTVMIYAFLTKEANAMLAQENIEPQSKGKEPKTSRGQLMRNMVTDFRTLMGKLDTEQFESAIMSLITKFCRTLEARYEQLTTSGFVELADFIADVNNERITLKHLAIRCIRECYTHAPETKGIFSALDCNAAYFLLILDFVLRCTRRGKGMFCESRSQPTSESVCDKLVETLERISRIVGEKRLGAFHLPDLNRITGETASNPLEKENELLAHELSELKEAREKLSDEIHINQVRKSEVEVELRTVVKRAKDLEEKLDGEQRATGPLKEKLAEYLTMHKDLRVIAQSIGTIGLVATNASAVNRLLNQIRNLP